MAAGPRRQSVVLRPPNLPPAQARRLGERDRASGGRACELEIERTGAAPRKRAQCREARVMSDTGIQASDGDRSSPEQLIEKGRALHRAGQLDEAERLYLDALAQDEDFAE